MLVKVHLKVQILVLLFEKLFATESSGPWVVWPEAFYEGETSLPCLFIHFKTSQKTHPFTYAHTPTYTHTQT